MASSSSNKGRPLSFHPLLFSGFVVLLTLYFSLFPTHSVAQTHQGMAPKTEGIPDSSLIYVSDYVSFVGEDAQGHVSFALDTNRGRDGDRYQAEHFTVLHDEQRGWLKVEGNGAYENTEKALLSIPDSSAFTFQGTPPSGWTIRSQSNNLTLSIEPIPERLSQSDSGGRFWMGSAPAILEWGTRIVKGRVIYEFFMMPDFNRLTRTYWGLWSEFQGLYLSVKGLGDVYVHNQESEMLAPLIGTLNGFLAVHEETENFQILQLTTTDLSQGLGFYKWPMKWVGRWLSEKGSGTVELKLSEFNRIATWVIGGFAMGIVRGTVTYKGQTYEVYGLGELIM